MSKIFSKLINLFSQYYWGIKLSHSSDSTLKNIIIFESAPDVSDNSKAVFDEFLSRKFNRKYKLVWMLYDGKINTPPNNKNVYYLPFESSQAQYYLKKAKILVCCNRVINKNNNQKMSFYLSHGSPLKSIRNRATLPASIDYCIAQSDNIKGLHSYETMFDIQKTIPLGFPRNDIFSKEKRNIHDILKTQCKKIIVWYPTFRKHKNGTVFATKNSLPIIHNVDYAKKLNEVAKQNDILIVLKPHFAQDLSYVKDLKLSNIRFIDDDFFVNNNISSYEFVGACDALITDYSSIYYDFTLCNKPIAAIWEDIEEYKSWPGLVKDYEYLAKGAEKVYTLDDFIGFLQRVGNDVDLLKVEREEIRDYVNISTDGKSSARVVDFIIEKSNLKL